eukprot:GFUD01082219.1.p1 GENE.GFUD01082219.1~~GFUD01082219.1.p1  ORF type:complete len:1634 (-),score=566.26 GFUD01082219.1:275-5176(-)
MSGDKLKCQFCSLDFTSVYKIIPHVYFGHRKKISRYVRDHQEVRLKCPAGCEFSHGVPVEKTAGADVIFPILSKVFLVLEDHMVEHHTKELKLTICPYCQKSLADLVYWEHLEEHMGSNANTAPTTPTPTTPTPTTPTPTTPTARASSTTPASPGKTVTSPEEVSPILKTPNKQEISMVKQEGKETKQEIADIALKQVVPDIKQEVPPISEEKKPTVIKEETNTQEGIKSEKTEYTELQSPNRYETKTSPKIPVKLLDTFVGLERPIDPSEEVVGFLEPVLVENLPPLDEIISPVHAAHGNVMCPNPVSPRPSLGLATKLSNQEEIDNQLKEIEKKIAKKRKEEEKKKRLEVNDIKDVKEYFSVYSSVEESASSREDFSKLDSDSLPVEKLVSLTPVIETSCVSPPKKVDQNCSEGSIANMTSTSSISTNEGDQSLILEIAPDEIKDLRGSSNTSVETNIWGVGDQTENEMGDSPEEKSEFIKIVSKPKVSEQRREEIKKELAEIERKIKEKKEEEKRQALLQEVKASNIVVSVDNAQTVHVLAERRTSTEEKYNKDVDLWVERRKEEDQMEVSPVAVSNRRVSCAEIGGRNEVGGEEEKKREVCIGHEKRGVEMITRSRESSGDKVRSREVSGEQESSRPVRSRNTSGEKKSTRSVWSRETSGEPVMEESGRRSASQESRDSNSQDRVGDTTGQERRDATGRSLSGGEQTQAKQKPVLTEEMERKIIYGGFKKKESREDKLTAVKREIETRFKEEEARKNKVQEEKRKAEEKEREKQKQNEEKLRQEREKLKEEKRKTKQSKKSAKENEEVMALLEDKEPDTSEKETIAEPSEDVSVESSVDNTPKSSPPRSREKSPDQYQKIKMEIMKIDIEIEKKQAARQAEKRKDQSRSPSPAEMSNNSKVAKPSSPIQTRKVPGVKELPKQSSVNKKPPTDQPKPEEEMDDLEMMMREFQEREAKERLAEISSTQPVDSLSQLRDSYAPKARSISPSPPPADTKPIIPSGFDQDGHPLPLAPLSTLDQDPVLVRAANNAARGIMGPARSKLPSHSLQLQCSLCKEEGPSASYYSAYQLLSHVFLAHRKKIVSRSRKARGMTLACPEGCGYTTIQSTQGVSIDFFNSQLPLHLASLCEHIIGSHTGEDRMDTCQFCSLPLDHEQGWSWQHLANHRDARRVYCNSCNNFPFKNEEHKCVGQADPGSNCNSPGPFNRSTASPAGTVSTGGTPKSDKTTKSLEELAREIESGVIKPEELSKQRHLGSVSVWVCCVCDQASPALSSWLAHTRSHLPAGQVRLPNHLKCFCCQWRPARFDRGNEVVALNQLVSHLLAEHNNTAWSDQEFEGEKVKLEQLVKDHEKRVEREKEEKGILVPKLPAKCNNCKDIITEPKTWKYHVLAHKFGEVFCSSCMTCVLGHQFNDHKVACTSDKKGGAKARVEKYRGDTWLDVGGKKLKVFYEYDESEDLGRVTIAKCMVKGNLPMMGVGVNHEEAANVLKEEVEDYFSTLKEQEDTVNKEQGSQEDKQALLDMFVELVKIDEANAINYFLTVGGVEYPVNTRMEFTKLGKVQIVASVEVGGELVTDIGKTRKEAVNNLAENIGNLETEKQDKKSAKFCCVECGSRFSKEVAFRLHQTIKCQV